MSVSFVYVTCTRSGESLESRKTSARNHPFASFGHAAYSRRAQSLAAHMRNYSATAARQLCSPMSHTTLFRNRLSPLNSCDSNFVSSEHYGRRCTTLTQSTKLTKLSNISLTAIDIIRFVYVSGWVCVCVCAK